MPADGNRLDQLIGTHLDGGLDAAQQQELIRLLADDPEARQRFARCLAMDTVLPAVARRKTVVHRWWPALAAAAVLAMAVGAWVFLAADGGEPLVDAGGMAQVTRSGRELHVTPGGRLRAGDVVHAGTDAVVLRWPAEGTRITVSAGSALELVRAGPDKALVLGSGQAVVDAGPQTGVRQLSLRTGRIAATVVGTRFRVVNRKGTGSIEVEHGTVAIDDGVVRQALTAGQTAIAAGTEPLWISPAGTDVGALLAGLPGAHLDAAAWQEERGTGWIGTVHGNAIRAAVEQTAEKVANAQRLDGYARLLPDLAITADISLAKPATLAVFLVCRRPDGSDWLGNYGVTVELQPGRSRHTWTLADLKPEKGAALSEAMGARVTLVAVCAWNLPAGLTVHAVTVTNASAAIR